MDRDQVEELDGVGCADALAASHARLVETERDQVLLIAQWCDLHGGPIRPRPAVHGAERTVAVGADGTPVVREFAADELGVLLCTTTTAARGLMRDVLDLRHRHPRLWTAVVSGEARFFAARQVVRMTHGTGLTREQAREVDERVGPYLGTVPWARMLSLVEAAVIAADPEAAEQRRIAAEMACFVRTGRSTEYGTTTIFARARAGDAIFFMAMCDRIAQILRLRGEAARISAGARDEIVDADRAMDVLRAEAIGILARPAQALALLAWAERHHRDPMPHEHTDEQKDEPTDDIVDAVAPDPDAEGEAEPGVPLAPGVDREPELAPEQNADRDPDPELAPEPGVRIGTGLVRSQATLYLHLSEDTFRGRDRGPVRVEGVGAITVEQAIDWLRHCHVTIRPVIDLNANRSVDGYQGSPVIRETVRLRFPVEVFPWGTCSSRYADLDHTQPYAPRTDAGDGAEPPGQTCPDNLGPLGRHHHRVKTHGGWQCLQTSRGVFYWRTPHGHWVRVDGSGTHYLGTEIPDQVRLHSLRRQFGAQQTSAGEAHLTRILDLALHRTGGGTPAGPAP
jgi:hypothetical protein